MPVSLRLTFWGDAQVDRTLERFEARTVDARPVWNVLADRFVRVEQRQFATEGAAGMGSTGSGLGYGRWAPLSPVYAEWKAAHYPGQTILRRTDALYLSLTEGPAIRIVEPHRLVVGSDVDYGGHHQRGDGNLPQRRPVEFTENERRNWVRALQRFIVTGEAGF